MRKFILIAFIALLSASVYADNWTDWKPVGDPNRGIKISTCRGASYGGGNVEIFVRYWNTSSVRFEGDVVLKYVRADGTPTTKNDTVDLPPTSQPPKPDTGDSYIAAVLTAEKLIEKGSSSSSGSQGVDEKTFPGEFTGWQTAPGLPNVFARRSNSASGGNYRWQFQNATRETIKIEYQYSTGGGGTVTDKLKLNSGQTSSTVLLPAEKIRIFLATPN